MDAKDFYLYAKFPESLHRLNLSKVRDSDFELVHDFRSDKYPKGMGFLIVDSKPYMFGGCRHRPVVTHKEEDGYEYSFVKEEYCLEAYELDPSNPQGPLVPVGGPIPKFSGPKVRPTVATIDGKAYVLSGSLLHGSLYDIVGPHFEVFDHVGKTWESLEDPPVYGSGRGMSIISYFAWGHRILFRTMGGYCIFDTRKSTWEDGRWFIYQLWCVRAPVPIGNAVEVDGGFYIALANGLNALGAYEFDPDGVIKSYRVLDEFSGVFSTLPELAIESCMGFVAEVGDGRLCFVFGGTTFDDRCTVHVALLRVSTVTSGLSVDLECLRLFDVPGFGAMNSVIIVSDRSKKRAADYTDTDVKKLKSIP